MSLVVDTGVLYADHDTDASRHEAAVSALESVYDGSFGQPYITDYIFDEAVTLARKRTGTHTAAARLSKRLRGVGEYPEAYELLRVSAAVFTDAVDVFEHYDDQSLSFTDATIVATLEQHDIDRVLSFDDDFDGVTPRLDPHDV